MACAFLSISFALPFSVSDAHRLSGRRLDNDIPIAQGRRRGRRQRGRRKARQARCALRVPMAVPVRHSPAVRVAAIRLPFPFPIPLLLHLALALAPCPQVLPLPFPPRAHRGARRARRVRRGCVRMC